MSFTERFSEVAYPLIIEHADSIGPAATASAWVNMANYHRGVLALDVGDMVATATLDAALWQASDSTGTGAKVIAGKSITQLTQAGGDGDEVVCIELKTEELDVSGGFEYVKVLLTTGTAAVEYSYIFYGIEPRFAPVPTTNWSEIVD